MAGIDLLTYNRPAYGQYGRSIRHRVVENNSEADSYISGLMQYFNAVPWLHLINGSNADCVLAKVDTEDGQLALTSLSLTVAMGLPVGSNAQDITLHCAITADGKTWIRGSIRDWISTHTITSIGSVTKQVSALTHDPGATSDVWSSAEEWTVFNFTFNHLGGNGTYTGDMLYIWFWIDQNTNAILNFFLSVYTDHPENVDVLRDRYSYKMNNIYYYIPDGWGIISCHQTDYFMEVQPRATKPNQKITIAITGIDTGESVLSFQYEGTQLFSKSATSSILVVNIPSTIFEDAGAESEETFSLDVLATRADGATASAKITIVNPNSTAVIIDETNFPDVNFRNYIYEKIDLNADGILSEDEQLSVLEIKCDTCSIESLDGIEYFPNVENLNCEGNQLTDLDISALTKLKCLQCFNNQLTSLDLSHNTDLQQVIAYNNHLQELDVAALTSLTSLNVEDNELESLDCSHNTNLKNVYVTNNHLKSLNLTGLSDLEGLLISKNELRSINITDCDILVALVKTVSPTAISGSNYLQYKYKNSSFPVLNIDVNTDIIADEAEISPTITVQPTDKNIPIGDPVYFTVKATGSYLLCEWYSYWTNGDGSESTIVYPGTDWKLIKPATSGEVSGDVTTFEIILAESATRKLNGKYRCVIYNSLGLVVSDEVTLNVYSPSSITAQPTSQTVRLNDQVTFSVSATGDLINYQWQKKADENSSWSDISGETLDTLSFTAIEADNGSKYRCVVSNEYGSDISDSATLTIILSPIDITAQPTSQTVRLNDQVTFSVSATGDLINYQWQKKADENSSWSDISGETLDTLSFTAIEADNGSKYRCVVSNREQSVTSNAASLSLKLPPRITAQPENITIVENNNASFSIGAVGYLLQYQWQFSSDGGTTWGDIRYSDSATLNIIATLSLNGYLYRCVVTNDYDSATSNSAILTVNADTSVSKPTITAQPSSTTVAEGSNATFAAAAEGNDISYQWQVFKSNQWTNIQNATSASYTTVGTRSADGNRYRCVISNAAGAVYSDPATLTVTMGVYVSTPRVLTQPRSVTAELGELVTFWIRADGGDLSYQWQKLNNNTWYDVTGATSPSYSLMARTEVHNTQYRCVISNTAGSAYSNTATLSIRAGHDLSFYGYHSIIISGKNTYGEWEMYPTSRPHVAPPEVKTSYVDLPGADGGLDYTDLLTGEPRYGYRKGSWEFLLIPQDRWAAVYRSLVNFLHGRQHTVILEDDPNYVYTGRLSVNEWQSAAHNSLITIDYILEPFPRNISGQEEDEEENQILSMASTLLNKEKNAGMVIGKLNGAATLIYPDMLFDNGDNIAY